jgi:hypothetical protein
MTLQVTQRQLSLFRSRKQRGVAPPEPSEFQLHVTIADVLRRWSLADVEWTHVPLGEHRTAATAGRLGRMGVRRGWADFQLLHADGRVLFVEVKRPGGRLSADQERIAAHMRKAGYGFEVVDSVEGAIAVLRARGAVRAVMVQSSDWPL